MASFMTLCVLVDLAMDKRESTGVLFSRLDNSYGYCQTLVKILDQIQKFNNTILSNILYISPQNFRELSCIIYLVVGR